MWAAGSEMLGAPARYAARLTIARLIKCCQEPPKHSRLRQRGFTLLELLVVITIIAIGSAGVSFALRDSDATALSREAERISAVLESTRAQARGSGIALAWIALPDGYIVMPANRWLGNPDSAQFIKRSDITPWAQAGLIAQVYAGERSSSAVILGAEPMFAAQRIELKLGEQRLQVASNGIAPFGLTQRQESP